MPQFTGSLVGYPARVSFAAYVLTILLGGFVLTLPACRQPGRPPVSFVDGVFTATSACCVTGLTVRSTRHDFSPLGQGVILEEDLRFGQRIQRYRLEASHESAWSVIADGQTVGRQRIIRLPAPVPAAALRLRVLETIPLPKIRRMAAG